MVAAGPHAVNACLGLQPVHCDREGVGVPQRGRSRFNFRCQPTIRREGHRHLVQAAVGAEAGGAKDRQVVRAGRSAQDGAAIAEQDDVSDAVGGQLVFG